MTHLINRLYNIFVTKVKTKSKVTFLPSCGNTEVILKNYLKLPIISIIFIFLFLTSCSTKPNEKTSSSESLVSSQAPQSSAAISVSSQSSAASNPTSSFTITPSQPTIKPTTKHIICIDPGHQELVDTSTEAIAPNSSIMKMKNPGGAEGVKTKIPEYKLNMIVGQKLNIKLSDLGYEVIMTRTDNKANISNITRAQVANNAKADLFLRIHADSVDNGSSVNGVHILIPGDEYIKDKYLITESKKIASILLDSFVQSTQANSRGLDVRNDMTGFNWCKTPMVLIEMGFLSNPDEDVKLNTDEYQNKIVTGITNGINKYFNQ